MSSFTIGTTNLELELRHITHIPVEGDWLEFVEHSKYQDVGTYPGR